MRIQDLTERLNKANREKVDAYNNLEKMRKFKLIYLEQLIQITKSADIFKTTQDYADIYKKSTLDQDTKVINIFTK